MVATLGGGGAAAGVAFCNLADEFGFTSTLFAVDTDDSVDTAGSAWSAGVLGFDATSFVEGVFASETVDLVGLVDLVDRSCPDLSSPT